MWVEIAALGWKFLRRIRVRAFPSEAELRRLRWRVYWEREGGWGREGVDKVE